tara:strand:+ start:4111 stop:5211 length:1101 start_codon:yes stop_codon:yes gene_type:complete
MKVSIGSRIVEGPWGGGNLFAINLRDYLIKKGHKVVFDLAHSDIDLILLTDPRSKKESSSTFNHIDILKYKNLVNPNVSVVQRVNECDERKNTNNINQLYLEASNVSDHVIFVSSWLREIYLNLGLKKEKTSVILAGSNKAIFNDKNGLNWNGKEKLKIVTHHWSSHENKGFKVYKELDNLLEKKEWSEKIQFSYIGNLPHNFEFKNSIKIQPLHGARLANKLKENHIYITASQNEPSGNHHIEAAQCGLPIMYLKSGGIPEYCKGFGVELLDLEETINKITSEYKFYKKELKKYPFNSEEMCEQFLEIFETIDLENKNSWINFPISLNGKLYLINNFIRKYINFSNFLNDIKSRIKKVIIKKNES